ncbi:MAG: 3-hydroxyacyl-ACP dehydratase FabZ [Candidatus Acidiferrales bacterium]|nr:3-hydroxyacyl-ACP dehydratase FabZ [Acidobacteriota bacterium]MCH7986709.1 3-hydroxyacyl-ACP dehydratase FabZ [Acidobacteriota bacterium]MCH8946836.1 3-hydroxyacyl-ACP dehydratase FabZ [Acidobacteriota bacterium]
MKFGSDEIRKILPHREPFLLVDEVLELEENKRIVAVKHVLASEPYFAGHFPGAPVMPGVLIVEAMAQAGALLLLREVPDRESKLVFFAGIDRARFRQPVFPGDDLRLELTVLSRRVNIAKMDGKAYVGDKLVAEAQLLAMLVDRDRALGGK